MQVGLKPTSVLFGAVKVVTPHQADSQYYPERFARDHSDRFGIVVYNAAPYKPFIATGEEAQRFYRHALRLRRTDVETARAGIPNAGPLRTLEDDLGSEHDFRWKKQEPSMHRIRVAANGLLAAVALQAKGTLEGLKRTLTIGDAQLNDLSRVETFEIEPNGTYSRDGSNDLESQALEDFEHASGYRRQRFETLIGHALDD